MSPWPALPASAFGDDTHPGAGTMNAIAVLGWSVWTAIALSMLFTATVCAVFYGAAWFVSRPAVGRVA